MANTTEKSMENILKDWCEKNISVKEYTKPMTDIGLTEEQVSTRPGKLVYQDHTGCSGGCSLCDVYLLESGEYQIYNYRGCGIFGPQENIPLEILTLSTLAGVVDFLGISSFVDPNTTMALKFYLAQDKNFDVQPDEILFTKLFTEHNDKFEKDAKTLAKYIPLNCKPKHLPTHYLDKLSELIANFDPKKHGSNNFIMRNWMIIQYVKNGKKNVSLDMLDERWMTNRCKERVDELKISLKMKL